MTNPLENMPCAIALKDNPAFFFREEDKTFGPLTQATLYRGSDSRMSGLATVKKITGVDGPHAFILHFTTDEEIAQAEAQASQE